MKKVPRLRCAAAKRTNSRICRERCANFAKVQRDEHPVCLSHAKMPNIEWWDE